MAVLAPSVRLAYTPSEALRYAHALSSDIGLDTDTTVALSKALSALRGLSPAKADHVLEILQSVVDGEIDVITGTAL